MLLKIAFDSCSDVFKRNCAWGSDVYWWENGFITKFFPNPLVDLKNMVKDWALYESYPENRYRLPISPGQEGFLGVYATKHMVTEVEARSDGTREFHVRIGLTHLSDQLISSFFGWIFGIGELLSWLLTAVAQLLMFVIASLILIPFAFVAVPIILFAPSNMADQYKESLWTLFAHYALYGLYSAPVSLLRGFYHFTKSLIRIPVGVGLAVKAGVDRLRGITSPDLTIQTLSQLSDQSLQQVCAQNKIVVTRLPARQSLFFNFAQNFAQVSAQLQQLQQLQQVLARNINNAPQNSTTTSSVSPPAYKNEFSERLAKCGKIKIEIPERYTCPIAFDVMFKPILMEDGNVYEQSCIQQAFSMAKQSPINRQPLNTMPSECFKMLQTEIKDFVEAIEAESKNPEPDYQPIYDIAGRISKRASELQDVIVKYVKECPKLQGAASTQEEEIIWTLSQKMTNNKTFSLTPDILHRALKNLQLLTGQSITAFIEESFPVAQFLYLVAAVDPSLNNLVAKVLVEAVLEAEQWNDKYTMPRDSEASSQILFDNTEEENDSVESQDEIEKTNAESMSPHEREIQDIVIKHMEECAKLAGVYILGLKQTAMNEISMKIAKDEKLQSLEVKHIYQALNMTSHVTYRKVIPEEDFLNLSREKAIEELVNTAAVGQEAALEIGKVLVEIVLGKPVSFVSSEDQTVGQGEDNWREASGYNHWKLGGAQPASSSSADAELILNTLRLGSVKLGVGGSEF